MKKLLRKLFRSEPQQPVTYVINAPKYVGSQDDLKRALEDLNRTGRLKGLR